MTPALCCARSFKCGRTALLDLQSCAAQSLSNRPGDSMYFTFSGTRPGADWAVTRAMILTSQETIMNRFLRRSLRATSVGALSLLMGGLSLAPAMAESSNVKIVRPGHGISLDVGSKHVVGYFLADAQACHVTLMMSDRSVEDEVPQRTAARIRQTVQPYAVARVDTAEGESLELSCHAGAKGLGVLVKTTFAANDPARR
jgi:hypothetical protein